MNTLSDISPVFTKIFFIFISIVTSNYVLIIVSFYMFIYIYIKWVLCAPAHNLYILPLYLFMFTEHLEDSLGGSDGKEPACNAGDPGSILNLGRCPGEGNGYPL